MDEFPVVSWVEAGQVHTVRWRSEGAVLPPKRILVVDDSISADIAYRHACEGTAMLWRGDFHNARQLLQAMARRAERKPRKQKPVTQSLSPAEPFHLHRQAQAQRARMLGMLLLQFDAGHHLNLRRAPEVGPACAEAYGEANEPYVASLRELLGLIGAHEWRKKGVVIPMLGARIHPYYGVFSPVRGEYVDLVAQAPLPATNVAFDIGTGSGVLAAVLAQRGVARVVATDQDSRALACARDNIDRLGLAGKVEVVQADLFPEGKASLIVCNPPWIPARPSAPIEHAIYDPDSRMLRGFLNGLPAHLESGGEGWLILSDIAEHLGLRTRADLLAAFEAAQLKVVERMDIRPRHGKSGDASDPLHVARASEITSLWRLAAR